MDSKMSIEGREAFLAQPWVGILSISEAGRGPLAVPVWYTYTPGGRVEIWTGSKTHKARLLHQTQRISLVVQDPAPPYRYVSVEGPFEFQPIDFDCNVVPLARRYFQPDMAEKYLVDIGGQAGVADDLLVVLHPERWLTVDYGQGSAEA